MGIQTATTNALAEKSQEKLEAYLVDLGAILKYPERKASFSLYALGLLSDGERKSVEPIAARAAGNDPQLCQRYHDRLCHFLRKSSPWPVVASARWPDIPRATPVPSRRPRAAR
jgi:SRSO17 transposase